MTTTLLTFLFATLASFAALGIGLVAGWVLRGRMAGKAVDDLHDRAQTHVDGAFGQRNDALEQVDEITEDMRELATQYRELHDDFEHLGTKHNNTLLQLAGVEDELRVQQESARLAHSESGSARRRIGQLEGELRALHVAVAKVANHE